MPTEFKTLNVTKYAQFDFRLPGLSSLTYLVIKHHDLPRGSTESNPQPYTGFVKVLRQTSARAAQTCVVPETASRKGTAIFRLPFLVAGQMGPDKRSTAETVRVHEIAGAAS